MKTLVLAVLVGVALAGCYREKRQFEPPGAAASAPDTQRATSLRPGAGDPLQPGATAASQAANYEENAYAVNQGKRLFRWYNCNGCHGQGGGGFGPALMDAAWLYGAEPADIYVSIVEGRPGGMPSFGGRISEDQVWQLVAYVRSMSGPLRKDVAPSRGDTLYPGNPENARPKEAQVPKKPDPPASGARP